MKLGIDIGGTFTDFVLADRTLSRLEIRKVPTTPSDLLDGIASGIDAMLATLSGTGAKIEMVAHGTTVALNALLERKGAATALLTTRGFRDVLEIGRLYRPPEALYDVQYTRPAPLVPRALIMEVPERVNAQGVAEIALDANAVREIVRDLGDRGVEAIAVSLLFSFLNAAHEQAAGEIIRELLPSAHVSLSSEAMPVLREFERTSGTVISAYIGPRISKYLERFEKETSRLGLAVPPLVMQSNGGLTSIEMAQKTPARMLFAGPAGGVVEAARVARQLGLDRVISIDMGGTSTDVSVVQDGVPGMTNEMKIAGYPLPVSSIDIGAIGAGGGSIAWIDASGGLRVGPQSAGAEPGPAAYGNGGELPTVTDANVVLGLLNPANFLGGTMRLDVECAQRVIRTQVAEPLNLDVTAAAQGIRRIVEGNMENAIRLVSVERGEDPRRYALLPFGGAGPIHACALANALDIAWVVVPPNPGVMSAQGLLGADIVHDYEQSVGVPERVGNVAALQRIYDQLEARALDDLSREGFPSGEAVLKRSADMRYVRQLSNLSIPVGEGPLSAELIASANEAFHAEHNRIYGFSLPDNEIEIVSVALRAALPALPVSQKKLERSSADASRAVKERRLATVDNLGGPKEVDVYDRPLLVPGNVIRGPAVIESYDSTFVLPSDMHAVVDEYLNIIAGKKVWRQ